MSSSKGYDAGTSSARASSSGSNSRKQGQEPSKDELDGKPPSAFDNANYFCEYAYMYHQMDMLEDEHRTCSYHNAITQNPQCFEGKVVLDVGAGTGILSIFAARAGAKMVYAVEATNMAEKARRLVEANGLGDTIRVLQGTLETIKLDCKVDVIVSEWMGYFLLRESMLDSVLFARDKFLKPGGSLWPSHATLYLAPLGPVKALQEKAQTFAKEKDHWATFSNDMKQWYSTDFSCLQAEFFKEQRQYYLTTGIFTNLVPKNLAGAACALLELDLSTMSAQEIQKPSSPCRCSMRIQRDSTLDGFCGYFDTPFMGSEKEPADFGVTLTTEPTTDTSTHWGQQMFGFYPPFKAKKNDILECSMLIGRQEKNHRLLRLEAEFVLYSEATGTKVEKDRRKEVYHVD
eukprot:TRINITY_DN13814_c0_g1_i1.p1 TRINITY_DN13814_c0_g1~~TRINITY_DN13814_c0_g1_i1.p1  ORF type:complete len:402 (+),score=68.30 TRINITY_DN13814_c0_g1_i1:96-1301(+)